MACKVKSHTRKGSSGNTKVKSYSKSTGKMSSMKKPMSKVDWSEAKDKMDSMMSKKK